MKKLIILISTVLLTNICQAQYKWTELTSPTTENLRTALISDNGDIYVFGNHAFGAKSSDNGKTWEIIADIDSEFRNITTCAYYGDDICIAGENALEKKYSRGYTPGWFYTPIYINGAIEKLANDDSKNFYCFPKYDVIGSIYRNMNYRIGKNQDSIKMLYNFYLPLRQTMSMADNFDYISCVAGNGRLISFLHGIGAKYDGGLAYIFLSDDYGFNWRTVNFSFPSMIYIASVSFKGTTGFITGRNHGGAGVYLYSSTDNGETWTEISSYWENDRYPSSVYTDFDGTNYNGIVVGKNIIRDNGWEATGGFVKVNNGPIVTLTTTGLNYITGDSNKIVIVGDNGKVFLGTKDIANINSQITDNRDLIVVSNSNGNIEIKSSKIIKNIKFFDMSGKLLLTNSPNSQSTDININGFPNSYFIQADNITKKIIRQ